MKRSISVCFAGLMAVSLVGCTFKHAIPIRYTPMVQMERLADKEHPSVVVLGPFVDERKDKSLFSKHLMGGLSVHKVKGETTGDLEQIIRDAFLDGFLKSGYEVPMGTPATTPFLTVTGRILTYNVGIHSKWKTVTMTGYVEVEVLLVRDDGQELRIACAANDVLESRGSISYDSSGAALDIATQACVKKLFADEEFRKFMIK
jgi:hypothetical protein